MLPDRGSAPCKRGPGHPPLEGDYPLTCSCCGNKYRPCDWACAIQTMRFPSKNPSQTRATANNGDNPAPVCCCWSGACWRPRSSPRPHATARGYRQPPLRRRNHSGPSIAFGSRPETEGARTAGLALDGFMSTPKHHARPKPLRQIDHMEALRAQSLREVPLRCPVEMR